LIRLRPSREAVASVIAPKPKAFLLDNVIVIVNHLNPELSHRHLSCIALQLMATAHVYSGLLVCDRDRPELCSPSVGLRVALSYAFTGFRKFYLLYINA